MRPRRASFYALEETIAALHEELQFTLNYAQAMVRARNYRAAAEVIDEQRLSLLRATKRMEQAIAPEAPVRHRARVRVAVAGVAATLALASGAFAAFGPASQRPAPNTKIQAIQRASEALTAATTISDPQTLQSIVGDAQETILKVAQAGSSDPAVKASLLDSVAKLQKIIRNPNVPKSVREQAQKVADRVQEIVVEVPETEEPSTDTSTGAPAETEPSV